MVCVELPRLTRGQLVSLSADAGGAPPVYEENQPQVVAIGSQIAEFAADVPAALRPQVANAFLLAQLAASRAHPGGGRDWYAFYVEVLANTGWIIERDESSEHDLSDLSGELHEAVIPVLTTLLGGAIAAAAMVTAVLEGLSAMDEGKPWITLFDRESRRAATNQFQISYADAPAGAAPQIRLAAFELDAERTVTQVLFFKFSGTNAVLRTFGAGLSLNAPIFEASKSLIEDKIADYVASYVRDIEI
jgi:hypothetical protein